MDNCREGEQRLVDRGTLVTLVVARRLPPLGASQVDQLQRAVLDAGRRDLARARRRDPAVNRQHAQQVGARGAVVGEGRTHVPLALGCAQEHGELLGVFSHAAEAEVVLRQPGDQYAVCALKELQVGELGREEVVALLVVDLETAQAYLMPSRGARAGEAAQHVFDGEADQARTRTDSGNGRIAEHREGLAASRLAIREDRAIFAANEGGQCVFRGACIHVGRACTLTEDSIERILRVGEPVGAALALERLTPQLEDGSSDAPRALLATLTLRVAERTQTHEGSDGVVRHFTDARRQFKVQRIRSHSFTERSRALTKKRATAAPPRALPELPRPREH